MPKKLRHPDVCLVLKNLNNISRICFLVFVKCLNFQMGICLIWPSRKFWKGQMPICLCLLNYAHAYHYLVAQLPQRWKSTILKLFVHSIGVFWSTNVVSNKALFYPTPLLEIFSFFLICYYTIKTIDDWDWGISNDCWKLVWSYQFQSLLHLIV